jgi:phosphatidate cytidylyltransferase
MGMAIIGALGDLAESAIKRSVSVKDSGTIIPGHGGVLDRVDSLLFTGPAFYYYALVTGSTY